MRISTAHKLIEKTRRDYDTIAGKFSGTRSYLSSDIVALKEYAVRGDKVLDLGCGNGRLFELLGSDCQYLGIDTSKQLIKIAKEKYPKGQFEYLSDPEHLPFADGLFDKVFCLAVIHHLPSKKYRQQFLSEVRRVLKPGGLLIITAWNLWPKPDIKWRVMKSKIKYSGFDFKDIFYPFKDGEKVINRYIHCFTEKEFQREIVQSGLTIQKSQILDRGKEQNFLVVAKK